MQKLLSLPQKSKPIFAIHQKAGNFATDWHTHAKHQLLYAEAGVLHLLSGTQQLILPARHGAWIPANRQHKIFSNSSELYLRNIYFQERENDDEILRGFHIFPVSSLAREMIVNTHLWSPEGEMSRTEEVFFKAIRQLAIEWCRQTMSLVLPTTEHSPLDEITTYIRANLSHPLRLEEVAQRYGFSGRTLLRMFKDQLGMTFGAYLRVARIIRAIELLTDQNTSVTEVAFETGYRSISTFSRTFQHLTGVKPSDYLRYQV
jgi:AraC-like DNA-binding protein